MPDDETVVGTVGTCCDNMNDGFEDIREQKTIQAELEQKIKDAKAKREKAKQTGTAKDFQDAVLADLDVIKVKLGI